MKNIKLIEVPSEIGAGTRGASLGVDAIKIAALDFMSNFFVHFPSEKIETENQLFLSRSNRLMQNESRVLIMYDEYQSSKRYALKIIFSLW